MSNPQLIEDTTSPLNRQEAHSRACVEAYLRQFSDDLQPEVLVSIAHNLFLLWTASHTAGRPERIRKACAFIPGALGWAHGMGWWLQPEIDVMVAADGGRSVTLMKWEMARCEALESQCTNQVDIDAVWADCRIPA